MHHFFTELENIDAGKIRITGPDVNHIKNVLRMKAGERALISDGWGTDYVCSVSEISDSSVIFDITDEEASRGEPSARFYLFQGLIKGDKFEHVIQKSVELGVHEIIPVRMKRSVARYDERKAAQKQKRWQAIAEAAAKQSKRGIIPEVRPIADFSMALKLSASLNITLIAYENFKDMKATKDEIAKIKPGMSVGIFIGPEGGIDEDEYSGALEAGFRPISLGSRILRTETAPIAVLSVLTYTLETSE